MRMTTIRIGCIVIGLLGPAAFTTVKGASSSAKFVDDGQGHLTGLTARITMRDGEVRTVKLDGVGCAKAICSRTAIKGRVGDDTEVRTWLDSLAAIRVTNDHEARFVSRDGTSRRMSLVTDFRVLYLADRLGGSRKLDLAKVGSIEFLSSGK